MRRSTLATAAAVTALATALVALPGVATAESTPAPTPSASQQTITGSAGEAPTTKASPQSRAAATPTGTEWVGAADVTPWTSGAFPATWFTTGGTPTFGASGATLPAATLLAHATTGSATTDLTDVRSTVKASQEGLGLGTADLIATGDARYALVVDTAGSTENATGDSVVLTTSTTGPTAVDGTWTATVAVGTIAAGTPATLADFQAQFAATTPDATINAYGALTVTGTGTVTGISRGTDNTYFTPEPTGTIRVQTPTTQSSLRDPGVQITATGFLPGEKVQPAILLQDLEYLGADQTFTADADGNVSGTATFAASVPAGDVALVLEGTGSGILVSFAVTVVADPTTPGTDPETPAPAPAPVAVPVQGNAAFTG